MQIRPFDGSLGDASGIIQVDRETFGDCEYTPKHIAALEADPRQFAWVAAENGRVLGFVSAFITHSLALDRWEVDELAVLPAYQGQGLGTQLVEAALHGSLAAEDVRQARALIATHNLASRRAFARNGFSELREADLLLYEVSGRVPRPLTEGTPAVRQAAGDDALPISSLAKVPLASARAQIARPENIYLVALDGQRNLGYAELIEVRTLQYHGLWLESIAVQSADRTVAKTLFAAAIEEAKRRPDIDLVGYTAPPQAESLYAACVSQGFHKVGAYQVYVQELEP